MPHISCLRCMHTRTRYPRVPGPLTTQRLSHHRQRRRQRAAGTPILSVGKNGSGTSAGSMPPLPCLLATRLHVRNMRTQQHRRTAKQAATSPAGVQPGPESTWSNAPCGSRAGARSSHVTANVSVPGGVQRQCISNVSCMYLYFF